MEAWRELIKKLEAHIIWEDESDNYTKQILDDIEKWLEEETEKQDVLEEKRSK